MAKFKRRMGRSRRSEVKLKDVDENDYLWLLSKLGQLNGVLYGVATDASHNIPIIIEQHQDKQVELILEYIDKMQYESGREGVRNVATKVKRLSPQLYVQMFCQVVLILSIINSAILFFVQRDPRTLGAFRWRIDQKNATRTEYEEVFLQVLPSFLQTASLSEPMTILNGANYRWFNRFKYPKGEEPTYLQEVYGIDLDPTYHQDLNIGKLLGEHVSFVDSKSDVGVQVADLLASGLRRCLRNGFSRNNEVAERLGRLMVQKDARQVPVKLVAFGKEDKTVGEEVHRLALIMRRSARRMIAPSSNVLSPTPTKRRS